MKFIRWFLGKIILFLDSVFVVTPILSRTLEQQEKVDSEIKNALTLYQLEACPFCVKVRRQLKRLQLQIPIKDIASDPKAHEELLQGGKHDQVPCLKIKDEFGIMQWLYESSDINIYLEKRFLSY